MMSKTKPMKYNKVRAKKHLGQHFLTDENVAEKIALTLSLDTYTQVLEIGAGTGMLTKYLLKRPIELKAMDLDRESIHYLQNYFELDNPGLNLTDRFEVIYADFLNCDLTQIYGNKPFAITGNFPYNISTQIIFKMLTLKEQIPEFTGMFQKEVAQRICASHGSKTYGILSVLVQAFYDAEYLFTVPPTVFNPPPKVDSGVLRLRRKTNICLACDEKKFFKLVKQAFQQRRKTLRNSLKSLGLSEELKSEEIFSKRPEQLSVEEFIAITQKLELNVL